MQTTDNVRIETPSLPKGGGAIVGLKGNVGATGPDGMVSLNIPLSVNQGRGYAPALGLNYYSGSGNGPFGMGWNINIPSIRRRTKKGVPQYDETDEFIGPDGEVLVLKPLTGGTASSSILLGTPLGQSFDIRIWRPRIEIDFSRLEHWVASGDAQRDFWVLYTPNGEVTLFGYTGRARISDPDNTGHTAAWLQESSVSLIGEQIYWHYRAEDDVNCEAEETSAHPGVSAQRYLAAIYYGNRTAGRKLPVLLKGEPDISDWLFMLVLDYGEREADVTTEPAWVKPGEGDWSYRQDSFSSWEYGFEIRTRRLCQNILSYHFVKTLSGESTAEAEPQLILRYNLIYSESGTMTLLKSVQQVGYEPDGTATSLPAYEFGWLEFTPPAATEWQKREDMGNLNVIQPYQMVDLNGEGLTGIFYQDSGAFWYRAPVRQQGDDPNAVTWEQPKRLPVIPSLHDGSILIDLNGDGYLAYMFAATNVYGYYERTPEHNWLKFAPLTSFPIEYFPTQAMFADITGSGMLDIVLIGPKSVRLYAGTGDGWEKAQNALQPTGVSLPVPDVDERVLVAFSDLAGSGQQHLIEVRADSVRYWPNKGHGQFGAPISMSGFSQPAKTFNPAQLYLADVDGSGTTDLIYAQSDQLLVYINQSGNRFADPLVVKLPQGVRYDRTCNLQLADVQGLGTASLVLTVPHMKPQHWICHLSAEKPWLLNSMNNNMGAQYHFGYRSSAQFWLDEKQEAAAAGETDRPSYLPFAQHLLQRSEVIDEITGNHLVSTVRYRSGVWDGKEREFRGFAFVEVEDSDTLASQGTAGVISMPAISRSWYATGLANVDDRLAESYWAGDDQAFTGYTPRFTTGFGDEEKTYEASDDLLFWLRRGLKGILLRSEVYGKDGSDNENIPFSVTENRPQVRLVELPAEGSYPVVWSAIVENRSYGYERFTSDPICNQQVVLLHDEVGQPLYQVNINYPRRAKPEINPYPDNLPETLFASSYDEQQQQLVVTSLQSSWHNLNQASDNLWLIGLENTKRSDAYLYPPAISPAGGITLEQLQSSGAPLGTPDSQVIVSYLQQWYLDSAGNPTTSSLAIPPRLAYSEIALLDEQMVETLKADLTDSVLQEAGYIWLAEQEVWAVHKGFATYATADHFWTIQTWRDTELTGVVTFTRDEYDCVIVRTVDAAGLTTETDYDWRFLTPVRTTDANNNLYQITLDALGRVTSSRFSGTEAGVQVGYSDASFTLPKETDQVLALTPPLPVAQAIAYQADSWQKGEGVPPHVVTLATDRYDTGEGSKEQQIRQGVLFSDGFGRELQTSVRYEAGEAWQRDENGVLVAENVQTDTRWAVSGRTEYDNKGQAVRTYQPYFLDSWQYVKDDSARQDLYADTHYYDALGREVRVVTAKGWLRRVFVTPWFVVNEDENDTADDAATGSVAKLAIEVTTDNAISDGTGTDVVKVTLTQGGLPLSGQDVELTVSTGATITPASGTTASDGTLTATVTSTVAGSYEVSVIGAELSKTIVNVNFRVYGDGDINNLDLNACGFTSDRSSVQATGSDIAIVHLILIDMHGNPVGSTIGVNMRTDMPDGHLYNQVNLGDGNYQAEFSSTAVGSATIMAYLDSTALNVTPLTITVSKPVSETQPMPDNTSLIVNGYTANSLTFLTTGFTGAKFQVAMGGDAGSNENYRWEVTESWATVDDLGNVTLTGTPGGNTLGIIATNNSTLTAYQGDITLQYWYENNGDTAMAWADALSYCSEKGMEMPKLNDLMSASTRGTGRLWAEWGDLTTYAGSGFNDGKYWLTDNDGMYQAILTAQPNFAISSNNSGSFYLLCRKAL